MNKAIKFLILLSILCYVNNFLYIFVHNLKTIEGYFTIWVISPLLFLTITSFILATDYNVRYKVFKKEAILDFIIRVIGCGVAFLNIKFEIFSLPFILQLLILMILFSINIVLELNMLVKAKYYLSSLPKQESEPILEVDKRRIKFIAKANSIGITSLFIVLAGTMNITITVVVNKYYWIIAICAFFIFLYMNYVKVNLFYLNKSLAKRIFFRDALYASLGVVFNFLIVFGNLSFGDGSQTIGVIIGVLSLYPTMHTTRKMALKARKIINSLGDDSLYYFSNPKDHNQ